MLKEKQHSKQILVYQASFWYIFIINLLVLVLTLLTSSNQISTGEVRVVRLQILLFVFDGDTRDFESVYVGANSFVVFVILSLN